MSFDTLMTESTSLLKKKTYKLYMFHFLLQKHYKLEQKRMQETGSLHLCEICVHKNINPGN